MTVSFIAAKSHKFNEERKKKKIQQRKKERNYRNRHPW